MVTLVGPGKVLSRSAVLEPPWFLDFTSANPSSALGAGRPWGDGTALAQRATAGQRPWDLGNAVVPMIGGDQTMRAMCDAFERAITEATTGSMASQPPGQRGHVYLADWQFNALRDLAADTHPWTDAAPGSKAQTALGLVCRMMAAGISVRLLLWMPTTTQALFGPEALALEHWAVAAAVQDFNATLQSRFKVPAPLGVVSLDLRTASASSASLHQKMVVVRVGQVNVAFVGGVDLAFTRRDFGLAAGKFVGQGDWQSGTTSPLPTMWAKLQGAATDYPQFPYPGSELMKGYPLERHAA
jgi:hypothetical protein